MSRILVSGASGFVGNALVNRLCTSQHAVRAAVRKQSEALPYNIDQCKITALAPVQVWSDCLRGVDTVIHCAARVHVMDECEADPLTAFREVNVDGTRSLALAASDAGVKRFIFLSSIKVNGESTREGYAYRSSDEPRPLDPYGISKREAEDVLRHISSESGMEHVIIRPVLVYGPGVKANFAQLIRLIAKGFPVPLGSTANKRSLVALDNLVDLITICIDHPAAANQTFLVSDNQDLSTAELIREIAHCLSMPPRLLPFPPSLLKLAATVVGKRALTDRLLSSLQVDISHTCQTLGWNPPITTREALKKTIDSFATG